MLARDRTGTAFRFAPLGGPAFEAAVPAARRTGQPDSLIVQRADGALLTRWAAVLHVLARLGGPWRVAAAAGRLLPPAIGDRLYDAVVRRRHRLFAAPATDCPLVPPELSGRFDR